MNAIRLSLVLMLGIARAACAREADPPDRAWPATPQERQQAASELRELNANLLGHASATLTLERWCRAHRLAVSPVVVARRVAGADKPLPPDGRALLGIGAGEPVRYRRVQLVCGDTVLSDADNWYVPARLTPAMNGQLDRTDALFGKVVQPLRFHRRTLAATLLWPLPAGAGDASRTSAAALPAHVLEHRAVLVAGDGRPFSLVAERYTRQVLARP